MTVPLAADTGRLPPYAGLPPRRWTRPDRCWPGYPAVSLHDHPVRHARPADRRRRGRPGGRTGASSWATRAWPPRAGPGWWPARCPRRTTDGAALGARPCARTSPPTRTRSLFAASAGDIPADGTGPVAILLGLEDLNSVGTDLSLLPGLFAGRHPLRRADLQRRQPARRRPGQRPGRRPDRPRPARRRADERPRHHGRRGPRRRPHRAGRLPGQPGRRWSSATPGRGPSGRRRG